VRDHCRQDKEGFQPHELKIDGAINGWYFGNILFGGLIGMLAVDLSAGAMYTLKPDEVDAALASLKVSQSDGTRSLTVVLVEEILAGLWNQLVVLGIH
jgi:hypothetical protein